MSEPKPEPQNYITSALLDDIHLEKDEDRQMALIGELDKRFPYAYMADQIAKMEEQLSNLNKQLQAHVHSQDTGLPVIPVL